MNWIDEASKENDVFNEILNFNEYLEQVKKNPRRELRPTYVYLKDIFNYYGKTDKDNYKLFLNDSFESPAVQGHTKSQDQIYQNLINFTEEGFCNKFILLIGPNGSAKSSLIRKIMTSCEDYSLTDEGKLYTFSWIFPVDAFVKGNLGLGQKQNTNVHASYAKLEDKDISTILASELRDHPFLLIPKKHRQQLIEEYFKQDAQMLDCIKKSYLYHGDVSKKNKMIYDALLKNYNGNYHEVLRHIRVERFTISKRYSTAAVTIEPQLHVDANLQQFSMDRRLSNLPPSLQSLNLFLMQGENVLANRGILEFSDLLKRPLDTFKYLLMTMETKNININGILTELDIFFIGSSNEIHIAAFKQHPDFNSFKARINFIRVPYLLNSVDEEKIYVKQIESLKNKTHFEPHAIEVLSLFAVMTRLRPSQSKSFENKKLGSIINNITPLEKCFLYRDGFVSDKFNSEEKQILKIGINEIMDEFENDNLYEGKFGISPREVKQIIYELAAENEEVSFIDVINYLEKMNERKNEYDFLNIPPHGDYHNPPRFLTLLKDYALDVFDKELRDSLGLVDERSYEDYICKYIQNVNGFIKKEKIKNQITGLYEEHDDYFLKDFETNINLKEDAKNFRSHMISTLGAFSLDHPGEQISYTKVFPEVVVRLKESYRNEQKKMILKIAENMVFVERVVKNESVSDLPNNNTFSGQTKEQILSILKSLQDNFKYSAQGAFTLINYLIKERY